MEISPRPEMSNNNILSRFQVSTIMFPRVTKIKKEEYIENNTTIILVNLFGFFSKNEILLENAMRLKIEVVW